MSSVADEQLMREQVTRGQAALRQLRQEIGRVIVGQDDLVDRLLIATLIHGHVLVEGLPGLAKTLVAKTLASSIDGSFKRIQFTPDLLPADITGTLIYDPGNSRFNARLGPIFANFVLADEINRAPAKVQSALLEAMQERQVTIGDQTYPLPNPFVVIATQNPIEHEGTYSLPEAQVDRFVMKVLVEYPSREQEQQMLARYLDPGLMQIPVSRVLTIEELRQVASFVSSVHLDSRISSYIVEIVRATRAPAEFRLSQLENYIAYGASPRATLSLAHVAKGYAFLQGRSFVIPEDIKAIAHDVLRHRILLTYEASAEQVNADNIIGQILSIVPVP